MAKNHLVIQLARIGDLVQSKRLVLSLAREGLVHIVLDHSLAEFAALIYPSAVLHPIRAHAGGLDARVVLAENARAFTALRELDFQSVSNLNRSPLSLGICSLFEPDLVHGYRLENGQPTASTWTRLAARWTADRKSSPLNLMDFWGFFHPNPIAPAAVNPVARARNAGRAQRIGIVLAGRESRRSLPAERLASCMEALFTARKGPELLLLGSKHEQEAARKVIKYLKPPTMRRVTDLSGKTSLKDLHEIIDGLDLVFTPDTGAMHLAAHLGVPVMAVFLSSAWACETGPYGLGHVIWQARRSCAPCLETAPCPHKVACLQPFAAPDFLAHLAGRNSGRWPQGLLGLVSRLDSLGVDYQVVDGDEGAELDAERRAKRHLLGECLNLSDRTGACGWQPDKVASRLAVEQLLFERDWMLPDYC